jgi:hypothetical protein
MLGLLLLMVSLTPTHVEAFEPAAAVDLCAAAEEIAMQRPCLRAEDCGAYQDWQRLFGPAGPRQLVPALPAARRAGGVERRSVVCPVRARPASRP